MKADSVPPPTPLPFYLTTGLSRSKIQSMHAIILPVMYGLSTTLPTLTKAEKESGVLLYCTAESLLQEFSPFNNFALVTA